MFNWIIDYFRLKRELESQQESPENVSQQTEISSEDPSAPGSSRRRHHRRRRQQDSESSGGNSGNDNEDRRRRRAARRAERLRRMNSSPPSSTISNLVGSNAGTHLATDHEDTSEGAVHCFQVRKLYLNDFTEKKCRK